MFSEPKNVTEPIMAIVCYIYLCISSLFVNLLLQGHGWIGGIGQNNYRNTPVKHYYIIQNSLSSEALCISR